jgi:uncharacterized membrane protein
VSTPSLEIPRRELAFREERGGFSLILKRNCSISPRGLAGVFAALAVLVLAISAGFAIAGAWLVLPFAGLEVLLLGAAFVLYARRAADYERIELDARRLSVEVTEAEHKARYELDPRRAWVCVEKSAGCRVLLRGPRQELEVGRHLDEAARVEFAAELAKRLRI